MSDVERRIERGIERGIDLYREANSLRARARLMRAEADAVEMAAERMANLAAAISDGREDDIVAACLEMGRAAR